MTAEELISQLKTIVNNDTAFCERAENIQSATSDIHKERGDLQ